MLRIALITSVLALGAATAATAGPMPSLPELPSLPTHHEVESEQEVRESATAVYDDPASPSGIYAGVLTGYSAGSDHGLGLAVIVGNTVAAADLLLGFEALGFIASSGESSIEGSARLGLPVTDAAGLFAHTGLGHSFDTGAFASVGVSFEAEIGSGWVARADYRYNHDLNGDASTHKVLAGLLYKF